MSGRAPQRVVLAIPVLLAGGTERQTLALATVLRKAGREVLVCCYHEAEPAVVAAFEAAGARVVSLGLPRALGLPAVFLELRRRFRELRPEVVHVQYLAPGFTAVLAARAAGVRTVFATVHQPARAYGLRERLLARAAARLCTRFFAVSLAVERSWFGGAALLDPEAPRAGRRHLTLYNAVDAEAVAAAADGADRAALRRGLGIAAQAPVIGYLGRVRAEKGLDVLVRALREVARCFPAVRLLVVGDGPGAREARQAAAEAGVEDRVVWAGMRERSEAWRLLAAVDVVAVPSRFEGFGLAAAEAQAAGRPGVASDVDGLREVVAGGESGLLVPPADAGALAAALAGVLRDPVGAAAMGRRGRELARSRFAPSTYARGILSEYGAGGGRC